MFSSTFFALGTTWSIECTSLVNNDYKLWLKNFENKYSRFIKDSFLNKISRTPGQYELDMDGQKILEFYLKINAITDNLFTPTIGQNLSEAGYNISYSLKSKELSKLDGLGSYLNLDKNNLTIKKPIQLDFGGLGKGYAVDKVFGFFSSQDYVYINAGGDIYIKSADYYQVALEHPDDNTMAIGITKIKNQSICGSAGNRRRWSDYHHIINPKTHSSPENIKASWVIAPTATIADSLATCLFLVNPETLTSHFTFEYLILDNTNRFIKSKDFNADIFTS